MTFTRSPARQLTGYEVVPASREFRALKRQFTSFAVPATAAFLAWYFRYVLLATFAPGFMRVPVFGEVNVGLYLGSVTDRRPADHARYARVQVRALTGVGAERSSQS
jgi:hypothetical protein